MFDWIINIFKACYKNIDNPNTSSSQRYIFFNEEDNEYYTFNNNSTNVVKL